MITILLLLFYFSPSSTTAIPPTSIYGNILARNLTLASVGVPACTCPDQRSIWDIIWSCLATIFACTWVSVHPDIPDTDEKWWIIVARRAELVIYTLLTPELVIYWAINQWRGARFIEREHKDKGWGRTHGYFMEMGGFMLYDGDKKMGTLSYFRFKELLAKDRIEFPPTTKEEIQDRSKNDGLSKFLVMGQTGWFILQCITRRVENLPITELELATLAFAALNGCMYFFWWNKPFDVRSPVPVKLRKHKLDKAIDAQTDTDENKCLLEEEEDKEADIVQSVGRPNMEGNNGSEEPALAPKDLNASGKRYQQTAWFQAVTLPWTALKIIVKRLDVILVGPDEFPEFNNPTLAEAKAGPMRVPTFYSLIVEAVSEEHFEIPDIAMIIIGSIFGAIHCAGWFFYFPTVAELWIWRISSLLIAVYPVLTFGMVIIYITVKKWEDSNSPGLQVLYLTYCVVFVVYVSVGLFFFVIARFLLVAECFSTLRDLPPGAYDVVKWTIRIPHI